MIGMDVADRDAFEVPQSLPGIGRSRAVHTEIPNELAPGAFTSVKKNITPLGYLYESARN
jgi:hypothetical protein